MKKLTLLFISLSMLVCLFACEKPKNNDDIENTDMSESEINGEHTNDIQDDNSVQHLPPDDYFSEYLYTKEELIKWLNGKQYTLAKSKKFISIYNEVLSGKRNLSLAYKNGEEMEAIRYMCRVYSDRVDFTLTLKDNLAKDGYVQIEMTFINDKMRGETDPWLVFRDFWPYASDTTKNKNTIKVMGKDTEFLYAQSDYEEDRIYYYKFVYEDVFVSVMMYDKNDSIEEFLDGFELRPLVLTDEKIPA